MSNSFGAKSKLKVGSKEYEIYRLDALEKAGFDLKRLPYSLKILLENLLRCEDGVSVKAEEIKGLAGWDPKAQPNQEIAFMPARVLMQDFTGVPAVVDLAAMRDAMDALGGDPNKINPLQPAEMVIDHSVQVDHFGSADAETKNAELEFQRNRERYAFLRWGQTAFENFQVVPPDTGIVHQVNLEYLARTVFVSPDGKAYPDTLVGTDSHTTMINGLGVLGWGVGGIEAEAAMLGQPISMLVPQVVGFRLKGKLPEGATATDLVLTVVQMLRELGVVGKFVEFFGPGLADLPLADRATIANMGPEYGATCGIFPIDAETIRYLKFSGRPEEEIALVEAYAKEQGMWRIDGAPDAEYSDILELDMGEVQPSIAGPKRPQDRILLKNAKSDFLEKLPALIPGDNPDTNAKGKTEIDGQPVELEHGSVVIAAITSCTNTSNPSVLIGAGLVAKKAVEKGLTRKPWVKTSLGPGSLVVTDYLKAAGLDAYLDQLGFQTVGYGCTTCIGNSGPLPQPVSEGIKDGKLVVTSVLSGNRNFEGRVHAEVRANYLMSPPLVVAYAIAGDMKIDLDTEPIGKGKNGEDVFLKDIWPTQREIAETIAASIQSNMYRDRYAKVFEGSESWRNIQIPEGSRYAWDEKSTYVKCAPFFEGMPKQAPEKVGEIQGARVLAYLGDSVTTDHISPAGSFKPDTPAGKYLIANGVDPKDFNSYGSRRGNHEVMMRGTFANIRIRNRMAPGTEGGWSQYLPDSEVMSMYDAAMKYQADGTPLMVLAGHQYGTGSSRDWAAKGTRLLGVKAVLAQSYERIHRSNLVGMGILPLQFKEGESGDSLGLDGSETFDIHGLTDGVATGFKNGRELKITAVKDGKTKEFTAIARLDTEKEMEYYRHGGILQYVLRRLASE